MQRILTVALALAVFQQPTRTTGVVDLTLGGADVASDEFLFQTVSGIAFDSAGRIIVTDLGENSVRIYSSSGAYLYKVGRKGAGPGEFQGAIGATFAPD